MNETHVLPNLGYLNPPDEALLQALISLDSSDDPAYRLLQRWLLASSARVDTLLRSAESQTALYRAQGASSILLPICEVLSAPLEVAAKLKAAKVGIRLNKP